jgi:hypothetical protein
MERQILEVLENEVNRRVSERLSNVVHHISRTYRLSYDRIMKEVAGLEGTKTDQCLGLVGKGTRCTRHARIDGYCKTHQDQKPRVLMKEVTVPESSSSSVTLLQNQHTHSLPPLFLAGCPACERFSNRPRLNI